MLAPAAVGVLSACSTPAPTPPGGTSAPGQAGASVPLAEVPVGGGTVVDAPAGPVLVTQPEAGTVRAYSAVCPHQGVIVGTPENGVITCSAHGSQFDAATGDVRQGPATTGLSAVASEVVGDTVQLS